MGIRRLGLLIEDKPYEAVLLKKLSLISSGISITALNTPEDIIGFDLILLEGDSNLATKNNKTIILSSRPTEYDLEKMTLFKYQSSKSMYKDLLFIFSKLDTADYAVHEESNSQEIRLYSRAGGSGVTSIALTMAYLLGLEGKKAIYLNAEAINSCYRYLKFSGTSDSKLLSYALSQGIDFDLSRFIKEAEGFYYFDRGLEIGNRSLEKITAQLRGFDYIIVDMGRVNAKREGFEIIKYEDVLDQDDSAIINYVPIDVSYSGVHKDGEAFKLVEDEEGGEKIKKINHYSIFTSDVKKILRRILEDGR